MSGYVSSLESNRNITPYTGYYLGDYHKLIITREKAEIFDGTSQT
jgi:hypothetical protein